MTIKELKENPVKLIADDWALVSAGTSESWNTMTVSWGGVGELWGRDVVLIFIRPQRYTDEFINGLNHVYRNTDGSGLISYGSCDSLTDPPGCIGTEFESFAIIKFLYRLDKTQVSFLDQIKKQHTSAHVTFRNGNHQS